MNYLKNLLTISVVFLFVTSCNKEDDPIKNWQDSRLCHELIGTSWQLYSIIDYLDDGSEVGQSNRLRPQIYTFTDVLAPSGTNRYVLEMYDSDSNITKKSEWYINGTFLWGFSSPSIMGDIVSFTNDCLQLRFDYGDPIGCGCDYSISFYKRVRS